MDIYLNVQFPSIKKSFIFSIYAILLVLKKLSSVYINLRFG